MTLLQHYWFKRAFSNQQLFLNWNTVAQCKPRRLCSPRPLLGIHPALKSRDLVIVAVLGRGVCVKRVAPLARTTNTRALSKQFLKTHTHTPLPVSAFLVKNAVHRGVLEHQQVHGVLLQFPADMLWYHHHIGSGNTLLQFPADML